MKNKMMLSFLLLVLLSFNAFAESSLIEYNVETLLIPDLFVAVFNQTGEEMTRLLLEEKNMPEMAEEMEDYLTITSTLIYDGIRWYTNKDESIQINYGMDDLYETAKPGKDMFIVLTGIPQSHEFFVKFAIGYTIMCLDRIINSNELDSLLYSDSDCKLAIDNGYSITSQVKENSIAYIIQKD